MNRKLIQKNESRISILQMIGFILMISGVISLVITSLFKGSIVPSLISVSFFITMLGFSFAFPTLLEGNEGLSTMRIIVFMVTNVICMLLLKIGWAESIRSLKDIGLDQWWMGVIAFVFGAKATQSFFESRMAALPEIPKTGIAAVEYSNADIAKLAVAQNEQYLKIKFPNILSVSDAVHDLNQIESHVIALYLKDNNTVAMPDKLEVKMPNGEVKTIATEIIKNIGSGRISFSQSGDNVSDVNSPSFIGSICCAVNSTTDENFLGLITSAHIYTAGRYDDFFNGILSEEEQRKALIDGNDSGNWFIKIMTQKQDLAVAKLKPQQTIDDNYKSFKGHYIVSDADIKKTKPNVTIISKDKKTRDAYILDYNIGLDIKYSNGTFFKKNIILIGSSSIRDDSQAVSDKGDSGSCVYHKDNDKLIGMLLGDNDKFSFILPVQSTLDAFNLKII